jgi:glycosyltransferase involved in cell wall biosynthesis
MISFVIPALNEGDNIVRCVRSIRCHAPKEEAHEIVVVDNGSKDDTVALASAAGARVLHSSARTVAGARNEGVAATCGDVLIFVDGDCALTPDWSRGISAVLAKVRGAPISAAGSHPVPPPGEDIFLWRHWFVPLFQQPATSHLGTAHLICRRDVFDRLSGFDERLETNEDFDFCARLREAGGPLLVEMQLKVEHHGFPRTWAAFFKRERWHARGSTASLHNILKSRVAIMSAVFAVGVLTFLVSGIMGSALVATGALLLVLSVPVASTLVKFRNSGVRAKCIAVMIFSVYYSAHAVAIIDSVTRRFPRPK